MLGHKWEPAHGTIVESRLEQTTVEGKPGLHQVWVYVVDVRTPNGAALRETVKSLPAMTAELAVGTAVRLEVNHKTGQVRFDPSQAGHVGSVRDAVHLARELRGEMAGGGAIAAALAGLSQPAAAGQPAGMGQPEVHVVGGAQAAELIREVLAGGGDRAAAVEKLRQLKAEGLGQPAGAGMSEVHVVDRAQAAELMHDLLASGGDKAAAMEKIRQLRAEALAQATGQAPPSATPGQTAAGALADAGGFSSPDAPSTFDPVTPINPTATPVTFSSPIPPTTFGPVTPATPATTFSSPVTSPTFTPVTPATPGNAFGSPVGTGSFGGGSFGSFGQESKSDRIARLEDQKDRGQLTQQQFEAQRQQILDEI